MSLSRLLTAAAGVSCLALSLAAALTAASFVTAAFSPTSAAALTAASFVTPAHSRFVPPQIPPHSTWSSSIRAAISAAPPSRRTD